MLGFRSVQFFAQFHFHCLQDVGGFPITGDGIPYTLDCLVRFGCLPFQEGDLFLGFFSSFSERFNFLDVLFFLIDQLRDGLFGKFYLLFPYVDFVLDAIVSVLKSPYHIFALDEPHPDVLYGRFQCLQFRLGLEKLFMQGNTQVLKFLYL